MGKRHKIVGIHKNREIDQDVTHKLVAWIKWRSRPRVLCDRRILLSWKENLHKGNMKGNDYIKLN